MALDGKEVLGGGYGGCVVGPLRSGVAGWVMIQDAGRMIAANSLRMVVHGVEYGVGDVGRVGATWDGMQRVGGVFTRAIGLR